MSNLTFVVPTYNSANFLRDTVASVYDGNFCDGDELILVDDCSTDGTIELIEQLKTEFNGIRLFQHKVNRGRGIAGVNTAVENAGNDLIFVLDHDNILAPGSIPQLKAFLLKNQYDAAAFREVRFFKDGSKCDDTVQVWQYKENEVTLSDVFAGYIWPGPDGNYMFTRESWIKAGRCNEFINAAIDCWAFGIRQLATGARMGILNDSFYYHRFGHESQFNTNVAKRSLSLSALEVLLPFIDLFDEHEVEYLFGRESRYTWLERLSDRPIKLKGMSLGTDGRHIHRVKRMQYFEDIVQKLTPPILYHKMKSIIQQKK